MATVRINRDYKKCSAVKREARAASVIKSMTGNKSFPAPPVKMADLQKTKDQYTAARIDAENKDRLKSSDKNKIAAVLIEQLDKIADYVTDISGEDSSLYLSSGFDIVTFVATTEFGPITNMKVLIGNNPGEMKVSCDAVKKATSYGVYYALVVPDKELVWQSVIGSPKKYTIKNLESAATYAVYMIAVGRKMRSIRSEEVRRVIP